MKRTFIMKRIAVITFAILLLTALPVEAADQSPPDPLTQRISAATDALLADLMAKADGKEYTIAAVPLVDASRNPPVPRRLGVRVADIVSDRLAEKHPEWLRVQSRIHLPEIVREQRLWIAEFMAKPAGAPAPDGLVERADFLVVGTTSLVPLEAIINLRIVNMRGEVLAAREVKIPTVDVRGLLAFPERPRDERFKGDEHAAVTHIDIEAIAQRRLDLLGTRHKQWRFESGAKLRGGDQIALRLRTDADAHVYIFSYSSHGTAAVLLPSDTWQGQYQREFGKQFAPQDNLFRAEAEYAVPGYDAEDTQLFFRLSNVECRTTIYIAASRIPVPDYASIPRRLRRARDDGERQTLLAETFKFDYVTTIEFQQE